jgi:TonB family protein
MKNSSDIQKLFHEKINKIFLLIFFIVFAFHCVTFFLNISVTGTELVRDQEKSEEKLIVRLKNEKSRQIVQTKENKVKSPPLESDFLSQNNNQFERQTRAREISPDKENSPESIEQKQKVSKAHEALKKLDFKDLAANQEIKIFEDNKKMNQKQAEQSKRKIAGSNDFIEDIPLGDFTQLNTQEYEFYGFYHRIKLKLEQFWGLNIKEQAEKIMKSGRTIASDHNHITSLTIELNENGEIVNIRIDSKSGLRELDQAAIDSFNQAGPFPNPPKKMLKNNRATIQWGFVVNT